MLKKLSQPLIAFSLGAFAVLGFAPFYIFPATIISLIGIIYLWAKAPSAKACLKLGFQFGLGLYSIGISWVYISLHDFGGMPWWFAAFCTFCLCAFMALFPALVGYFSKRLTFLTISTPVLWGLSDWVRSWIFTGFPWLTIGYSQTPYSPLAGYMPIVGVYGTSIITVTIAAYIAIWLANKDKSVGLSRRSNVITTITLLVAVGGILKVVPWSSPVGEPFSASLIQGNIGQDIKWSPDATESTIAQYVAMTQNSQADLIVLPETALPVIATQLDPNTRNALSTHAKQNNSNIIVGMVNYDRGTQEYFNSAFSLGTAPTQSYSKNHLVPFGEFIPLKQMLGWVYRDWLNIPLSDLSRGGTHQQPMLLNHQKVAVNICYEDVFGEEIIRQLPEATVLVNISNDAWYGQSYAADQHMQFSQARALETGRMVLRSTNTGATAMIDQHGYVLAHAPHDTKTTLNVIAQGYEGTTPYVLWGNWPFIAFSFSVIAFVISRKKQ
ncbi:MAG: apolipoprotein N-acyltransferase [Methylophilaceae bacterium]